MIPISRPEIRLIGLPALVCCLIAGAAAQVGHITKHPTRRAGPVTAGIPQSGLIADVPFTEQTGTVAHDITGNGNDCTFLTGENSPTWNRIGIGEGYMGPNSGGSYGNQSCSFPATLATATRSVAICAYLPASLEMEALDQGQNGEEGILLYATMLGAQNRSGSTLMLQTPNGSARLYYQQSTYFGYGGFSSATNDMSIGWNCFFYVFGSTTDSPATVDHLYKNGEEVSSYAVQSSSETYLPQTGQWYLGGGGWGSYSLGFVGTFEHVLAWDRMLSASEVASAWQTLQAELLDRGAVFNPVTSQTTDSVADCLGDSQTVGGDGESYCTTANFQLPAQDTWLLKNNGVSGTTCVTMESGVPREEALDWSPNAPHSLLMLWCGINDLTVGGETPAQIWPRQLAICQLARNAGYENIVDITLPSWVSQDTNIESLNTLIRANWTSCFTGLVDEANDPRLGAAGAYTNPTYFQQGGLVSHLTTAGQQILGGYAANNIASLYGNTTSNINVVASNAYSMAASDNYVAMTSAGSTLTLPDCLGYPPGHTRYVLNAATGPISVVAQQSEGINDGQAPVSVAAKTEETFAVQLVSPTAAGCTWQASTVAIPSGLRARLEALTPSEIRPAQLNAPLPITAK